ncbi:two pore potassium channel protein sup-9-like [Aricia agestis]|uniref:two pore potassium channel protein sup-9-like n=1 Tax=Aricia agestis TaxID=91739 RepID=UPI001C20867F|nr:two pore potassium channel protein sup-9-like [Aricia agestis]XP_041983943.1 two pore potassium channel protein sup-9-like [Aricia agestis]XP_041983944.1 two pore potassium channel protein sup-9-like [Aricia agestis]XP_041983945.1 two pore potassium channel protein sup-9-like [Aricia agestis]XP_041983947.1 two pore potassium channel protein sup-9-like [Aricia agestis]XP_041983948.1 two pore potassium channel protein sup-9-like [Aricia agestis]XP_041983949.1 two pore potassium channel prote
MKKQNVRTLSLIVCTFTYLLVGAAVFDSLESETERNRFEVLQAIEGMIIRKYNITEEDFRVMETVVLKSEPHKAGQQWKFTGAFYYATTVLTTIGYGHSTPSTIGGKLFTMFYAIVGIPLGLIMFQSIGERVNRLSSVIIKSIKRALKCKQTHASEVDLICVVTTLSSLTIAGGAAAFSKFEGWSYFDSVYYCFITLTTIGFGDMVALQKDNALNRKPSYVMFALIFILFGLAIVAACLNLLVLRFVTMNTEDEKRDQQQAEQAQQVAVRLEGDVITADGDVLRGVARGTRLPAAPRLMRPGDTDMVQLFLDEDNPPSVCSCTCSCFPHKSIPYRDPLSPIPPTNIRQIKSKGYGGLPRYIEKSSSKNRSQSLRLNSASGYLYMNAKTNDFQLEPEDFREMVAKRREQLRKGMNNMENEYVNPLRNIFNRLDNSPLSSSLFSMNMKDDRSNDPLVDEESEKSSYARRKLMKNIARNTRNKRVENYFYDDAVLHFDDEYAFDGSILFAKRRKSLDPDFDEFVDLPRYDDDGSYGYYIPDDESQEQYFVNDTLTFNLPSHRASI